MKIKKKIVAAITIIIAVAMLAGCGGASGQSTQGAESALSQSSQGESAAAENGSSVTSGNSAGTAAGSQYTFVWMSDTQYYSEDYPDIFESMTGWIADNVKSQNIKALIHTGDLVNTADDDAQWQVASDAMSRVTGLVPYTVLPGNKDITTDSSDGDYTNFLKYFGRQEDKNADGTVLWCGDGESRALLLEAGSSKYIIVSLAYGAGDEAFSWADDVLQQNSDRIAIITTHDYMKSDGSRSDNGKAIYKGLVKKNSNVRLVLCGHKQGAFEKTDQIDDNGDGEPDRTVYQLLADYQGEDEGGSGFLRLLAIDESAGTLRVQTYSPYTGQYNCFDAKDDSFTIPVSDWFE